MNRYTTLTTLLVLLAGTTGGEAKVIHVTPETAGALPARLAADPDVREVVFAAGVYHGGIRIAPLKELDAARHPLLLRADDSAEVVFDGSDASVELDKAEPVAGHAGVYAVAYTLTGRESPKLWEQAARVRYQQVADVRSVARYPATYATQDNRLYFHTSDGRPPQPGQLAINHAQIDCALSIARPHVTVRGMTFRNYLTRGTRSTAIQFRADHITVEDCTASNCSVGFFIVSNHGTLRNSRADDCGGGVYVGGNDATVENCRFFKRRDAFMVPMYEQDDSGIQHYYPATRGTVRGNVAQGFARGITLKCDGAFLVEHNTIVDCHQGILRTSPKIGDRFERNLIVGCSSPGLGDRFLRPGVVNDWNVFWDPGNVDQLMIVLKAARMIGTGRSNVVADPRFVDRAGGDFRLAPDSVCITASGTDRPVGAMGVAPADFADTHPPTVRLHLGVPAAPAGAVGRLTFERDPWIGGGTTFIEELRQPDPEADYDTAELEANIEIDAEDAIGKPALMSHRLNHGPWSEPAPYARRAKLPLPDAAGIHTLALRVQDDAGNWSQPTAVRVRLVRQAAALDGRPTVYANDHGVVLSFRSTAPAFARVEYSLDQSFSSSQEQPQRTHRRWNSNDGGDWVTRWRQAGATHHVPLLGPEVKQGATYHYRIVLEDTVGRSTQSDVGTFTVAGAARTWSVSTTGVDADACGTPGTPVGSIQFAVNRALPGDRVVLSPGVYPGDILLTQGGTHDAPITIEAAESGGVILDSARSAMNLLRLERVGHIVIRNLELRGYQQGGSAIYLTDSPNVTIEGCTIWNGLHGEHWPFGLGIFAHRSPGITVRSNVLFRQEHGIYLLASPEASVIHNTAYRNLFTGMCMYYSAAGSRILNNSFTYNVNDQMLIEDSDQAAFKALICDYNNLAGKLRPIDGEAEAFSSVEPEDAYLAGGGASKAIVNAMGTRYRNFEAWQKASGKDAHSIFADPRYVDASTGDGRLKPNSPNIGAGQDGATIGTLNAVAIGAGAHARE